MKRILFICLGSTCRSPMAESIMRDLMKKIGVGEQVLCVSAATSSEEVTCGTGNPIYPAVRAELKRRGIPCGEKRAILLKRAGCVNHDYLIHTEERNLRDIERTLHKDPEGKPRLLLPFVEKAEEKAGIVDPWYTGDFATYADQITADCEGLLRAFGGVGVRPIVGGDTVC